MSMDSSLRKEITDFLIQLPSLQTKEGRQAVLLSAGLEDIIPHIDLSGSAHQFIALLIKRLEEHGTLADGRLAPVCLLQEIKTHVGQNRQEILQDFCERLKTDGLFTHFAEAPGFIANHIRIREFQSLITEHTRNFVGREFIFKAINDFLHDPEFPSGYIVRSRRYWTGLRRQPTVPAPNTPGRSVFCRDIAGRT